MHARPLARVPLAGEGPLTLVTATKVLEQSHLSVLEAVLERR